MKSEELNIVKIMKGRSLTMNKGFFILIKTIIAFWTLLVLSKYLTFIDRDFIYFWLIICGIADVADQIEKKEREERGWWKE